MKNRKILIGLLIFISIIGILDLTLKIRYSEESLYEVSNLMLSDSIVVESGKIFIGKNILGEIEAVIFPDKYLENDKRESVEYVYMRFYPEWFNDNMAPIVSMSENNDKLLFEKVRSIHEKNFRNYMHLNDYPIVRKDYVPIVIKKKDCTKIRFTYNLSSI